MLSDAHQRFREVLALGLLAGLLGLAAALYLARVRVLRPLAILTEVAARAGAKMPEHLATGCLPDEFDVLRLAVRDALTSIANRRSFNGALAEAWAHALLESDHVALVILDVDFFKKFNDLYGHLPGDACLCRWRKRSTRCVCANATWWRGSSARNSSCCCLAPTAPTRWWWRNARLMRSTTR